MKKYHKINTLWKRDEKGKIIEGEFSLPEFKYLQSCIWRWTEKIDGTNVRVKWENGVITFAGKTDKAQMPAFLFKKLQDLFPSPDIFQTIFGSTTNACLYGEGFGKQIQKCGGNYIPDGVNFILIDIWIEGWWLKVEDVYDIAQKFELNCVPVVGSGNLMDMNYMVKTGFNSIWGDFPAEGIVAKPMVDLFARNQHRIVTKLKHKDFK